MRPSVIDTVSFLQRKHRRENSSRKSSIEPWKDWRSQPVQYCLETWQGAYTLHWNTEEVGSDGGWTDLRQSREEERKLKKLDKWTKGFQALEILANPSMPAFMPISTTNVVKCDINKLSGERNHAERLSPIMTMNKKQESLNRAENSSSVTPEIGSSVPETL